MAPTASLPDLPNPYTSLAWLPPDTAYEFQISRYLYVVTISAYVIDWIIALPDEYNILFKSKFRMVHIAYVGSRLFSFGYILGCVLFQISPIPNCQALEYALATCFAIALPCTSALFFLRACAVFGWNRIVVGVFGFLWASVLIGAFTIVPAIKGEHIGTTQYCINSGVAAYSSASIITNTVNDTLVFLAISWRITYFSMSGGTLRDKLRSFAKGDGLPRFSRMLLQGGQLYYFATVALNIVSMTLLLSPGLSPILRAMTTIPNVALENAMATRVFRAIHTGHIAESAPLPSTKDAPSGVFRGDMSSVHRPRPSTGGVYGPHGFVSDHITISKVVETIRDEEESQSGSMEFVGRW